MLRRSSLLVATAAAAVTAAPAAAATAVPDRPALLPAVKRTLSPQGGACTTAAYRAPMSGFVTTRLKGRGDWDLVLRDGASRRKLAASRGFGGSEVTQTWVAAGQRLVAEGCRRDGAGRRARISFVLADVAPPKAPAGTPKLVRVEAPEAKIHELEDAGFDVTHKHGPGWADVIVAGDQQLAQLRKTGLKHTVRIADLNQHYLAARKADRAYSARLAAEGSPLPSGRTEYRMYEDYQAEMKELVEQHPGLVRKVVFGKSFQGREMSGIEIANDVNGHDGRPVYFLMGVHHAREWPSGEAAMEFAHLLVKERSNPRIARILRNERVVILPIVNPDGYIASRTAFDPADSLAGGNPNVTLVEIVAPPGGIFAYRRKNCDGEVLPAEAPCELAWGVDNNRNYGNLWGGPGSSSDVTSQSYHGPGPRSEPETQAVWNFARTNHVTTLVSIHNVAALVLRPPGLQGAGLAPDEDRMKQIGDAMGKAAGYTSQYSWQLYDTAGTTEDDTYAATGGFGYTIEMGPPDGDFHMPYETGVVKEWTGDNDHAKGAGGLREALLIAAESAAVTSDHAVVRGTAPPGKVLRLKKAFDTKTSEYCSKSVELLLDVGAQPPCVTGMKDPITLKDTQDTKTVVPASGAFDWHVGPSTRPFVGGGAIIEKTQDVEPPIATINGAPGAPTSTVEHEFTAPAVFQSGDKLKVTLTGTLPEDYDIEVLRDGKVVGSSAGLPGAVEEVLLSDPQPGKYVVRVHFYAAVTGVYEIKANRVTTTRTVTPRGAKEAYTLTCETPDGKVLEQRSLVIDRGQAVHLDLGCGQGPSTFADGTPLPQHIVASSAPAGRKARRAPRTAKLRVTAARRLRRGRLAVRVTCPREVLSACRGAVRVRGFGARAFTARPGRSATVRVRASRAVRRTLARRKRIALTIRVTAVAGATKLTGSRRVTLRR